MGSECNAVSKRSARRCELIQDVENLCLEVLTPRICDANLTMVSSARCCHVSKFWRDCLRLIQAIDETDSGANNGSIALFLKSGSTWSLHEVSEKDLHLGLFVNQSPFIIIMSLNKGDSFHERC